MVCRISVRRAQVSACHVYFSAAALISPHRRCAEPGLALLDALMARQIRSSDTSGCVAARRRIRVHVSSRLETVRAMKPPKDIPEDLIRIAAAQSDRMAEPSVRQYCAVCTMYGRRGEAVHNRYAYMQICELNRSGHRTISSTAWHLEGVVKPVE